MVLVHLVDLWYPLRWSTHHGMDPVPYYLSIAWLANNARQIAQSQQATDPFPDGVLM